MAQKQKSEPKVEKRILNRLLARELTREELELVTGGCRTISYDAPGVPGDIDSEAV